VCSSDLRTGARLVGIDASPVAIRLAGERTKEKRERLAFRVGDINRIGQALADCPKADAIMALEVLYAAGDLPGTIGELAAALGEQGRMLFIANQHIEQRETEAQRLRPEGTDIALAIKGLGLPLAVTDLTENKVRFLERSFALLEEYQAIFEEEGSRDFWAGRILYDRRMLRRVQDWLTRRFMYYCVPIR
jgi:hypothetical protein